MSYSEIPKLYFDVKIEKKTTNCHVLTFHVKNEMFGGKSFFY